MVSWRIGMITLALMLLTVALGGCDTREAQQQAAHEQALAAGEKAPADQFHITTTFSRRYTKKHWLRDKDLEFRIKKTSRVRARVTFHDVRTDRLYSAHLVWIRPDGRELYRRYAEVAVTPADSGGYDIDIAWKKAVDLHHSRHELQHVKAPSFMLESIFDISRAKHRETGEYLLRIYLDRQLLKEETITIVGS